MELDNLKTMWKDYDSKLEQSLNLNLHTLDLIQTQKIKSALMPLYWQRITEISFHTVAIVLVLIFCFYNYNQMFYAISGYMLIAFYSIAFRNCFYQLKALNNISSANNVISVQSALATIKLNSLHFVRLSVLFIPALLAFPVVISKSIIDLKLTSIWSFDIIKQTHGNWWIVQVIAFIILIPLGIWFYNQVDYKNTQKRWVGNLIDRVLGKSVRKAIEYLRELEVLNHDNILQNNTK